MLVIASEAHREHHTLELSRRGLIESTEAPQRAEIISSELRSRGHRFAEPNPVELDAVTRVHTREYLDFLVEVWPRWVERFGDQGPAMAFCWPDRGRIPQRPEDLVGQLGYHSFAADCSIGPGTWKAAIEGAAIAQSAVDACQELEPIYGLCRPPGHHASADQFGGYCFINNGAVAAQRFLDRGASRVVVLDIDYHHGNGTQSIFYERDDVHTVSIHADPTFEFPWFTGHRGESGAGAGLGANVNLPLGRGTDVSRWNEALTLALDRVVAVEPEALVVALGVDTYIDDPLGTFTLETTDYATIGGRIRALGLPTVILQEGGYATANIGANVASFLSGFS